MNKIYSSDGEVFFDNELEDAVNAAFDYETVKPGDVVTVYEGELNMIKTSGYLPNMHTLIEIMQENLLDTVGECADGWLDDVTEEQRKELKDCMTHAVDKWADKHELHPKVGAVKNIKPIAVRMLDPEEAEFEVLAETENVEAATCTTK